MCYKVYYCCDVLLCYKLCYCCGVHVL
jgi:hypothetical protein